VSSCLPSVADAIRAGVPAYAGTLAGTMVVRASGLRVRGGTATAGGDAAPAGGELAVFCRPVVTAPAVVRRDGTVLADAWLPDLVRLGELERHLGDGVIEAIVDEAVAAGRLRPRQRRRLMSYPLVIRLMIAMVLMPDGSYCEALARLAGLLADIPFTLEWHVPTEKVVTDWRVLVPADVMEDLFWQAAGPLTADDEPSAVLLAGMTVLAADGMLVNLADTSANRAMFGSAGTADDSSPFPQLRIVALAARAGRAMPGAILGSSRAGEQTLLKRLARRRPELFAGRVTCFDRNFPGYDLITAILDAGGHVVARVSATVALPLAEGGGWLPDGSRMTWLNAPSGKKQDRLPVRAAEHNVILPCGDGNEVSETCTVITTLLDHQAAPAGQVRETYLTRWSASETTFGEDKTTITGAGNRTSGPVLRSGSPRLVIQEAWAWLTGTQLTRASEAAALRGEHAAARALRRKDAAPVTADEESFTAARHHMIRSMTSTQVTATSSLDALAAAADAAARACLRTLNVPGRQRHSRRAQKARPKFPHATATKTTVTGKPQVTVFAPVSASRRQENKPSGRRNRPRPRGPRTVEPRVRPAATRGQQP
jgi:Insertion element 4 transposase N-terminal